MFRVYVTSLLQYKAQFLSPCVALCKAYVKSEQRVLACPWNAMPEQVHHNLTCLGMRVELPYLETLARAAQVRLVASLPCFWDLHSQACRALNSDDCILGFLGGGWHLGTSLFRLAASWRAAHSMRGVLEALASEKPKAVQGLVYVALRGELSVPQLKKKLGERLTKLFGRAGSFGMVEPLIGEFGSKSQLAPLAVRASVIKTVCNAWITSSRMHGASEGCRFGCGADGADAMKHYFKCAHLRGAVRRYLEIPPVQNDDDNLRSLLSARGKTNRVCLNSFIVIDAGFFASNLVRNSPDISVRFAVSARIESLCSRYSSVRAVIDSRHFL